MNKPWLSHSDNDRIGGSGSSNTTTIGRWATRSLVRERDRETVVFSNKTQIEDPTRSHLPIRRGG